MGAISLIYTICIMCETTLTLKKQDFWQPCALDANSHWQLFESFDSVKHGVCQGCSQQTPYLVGKWKWDEE